MFLSNGHTFQCPHHFRLNAKTFSAADGAFSQCHMEVWHARQQSHSLWAGETQCGVILAVYPRTCRTPNTWAVTSFEPDKKLAIPIKVGQSYLLFKVDFIESSLAIEVVENWRFDCLNTASLCLTFHQIDFVVRLVDSRIVPHPKFKKHPEAPWVTFSNHKQCRSWTWVDLLKAYFISCLLFVSCFQCACMFLLISYLSFPVCFFLCCLSVLFLQPVFMALSPLLMTSRGQLYDYVAQCTVHFMLTSEFNSDI